MALSRVSCTTSSQRWLLRPTRYRQKLYKGCSAADTRRLTASASPCKAAVRQAASKLFCKPRPPLRLGVLRARSEERRVGKEGGFREAAGLENIKRNRARIVEKSL